VTLSGGTSRSLSLVCSSISSLLLTLALNGGADDLLGAQALRLGGSTTDLNVPAEVFVLGLQSTASGSTLEVNVAREGYLASLKMSFGLSALDVTLRLLDSRLSGDLGHLSLLFTLALGLTNVTAKLRLGDVNTGLVGGALVCLACQGLEVNRLRGIFELFNLRGISC
jgi:hypothetical protein